MKNRFVRECSADRTEAGSTRACVAAVACVLALAPATVSAGLSFIGGGDPFGGPPFYQSFAEAGFDSETNPGFFQIDEGKIYWSNTVPRAATLLTDPPALATTLTKNGATMQANASAIYNGFFSARNFASASVTNAQSNDGYYVVAGSGTFTTVQFFAPVEVASTRFHWHVSGTDTGSAPGGCTGDPFPRCATGRLDFMASTDPNARFFDMFSDPGHLVEFGPGDYTYDFSGIPLGQVINLFYWSSAFTQVEPGAAAQGSNLLLTANYANTFDLLKIDAFDAGGNLIPQWTLMDLSTQQTVFDQNGRVVQPSVPEPETLVLLGAGLAGLAISRRRRSVTVGRGF